MNEITVSVTCTNCGCPVVLRLRLGSSGGIGECCYNCSGIVTGTYDCYENGKVIIRNIKTLGGAKK